MKWSLGGVILLMLCTSCNDENSSATVTNNNGDTVKPAFFPVTDFLNGQLSEIRTIGINPLKIVHIKERYDSSWIKIEQLQDEFRMFLEPLIDSSNMARMFTEKSFLDQTINAVTFTYDPSKQLPDSFSLKHWDVYVDPQKNTVTRIYMLKKQDRKIFQLTWQAGKWCKIVTISPTVNGTDAIEQEVTIKWDF
ncbi:MAG: hypothetical protein ABIO04_03455 [Ferruginibacter sp.]